MTEQPELVSIFGRKPTNELNLLAAADARLQNVRQSIWRQRLSRREPLGSSCPHWLQSRAQTAAYYAASSSKHPDDGKHVEPNGLVPCDDTIRKLLQKLWPVMSDKSQRHLSGEMFTALTANLYRILFRHDTLPAHLMNILVEQDWQVHTGLEAALDFSALALLLLDFMVLWIPEEEAARSAHGTYFVRLVTSVADFDHDMNVLRIKPLEHVRCWYGPSYERIRRDSMSTYNSVVSSSSAEPVHPEHVDTKAPTARSPNQTPTRPGSRLQHTASQLWTYPDSPSGMPQGQRSPQSMQRPQISITVGPWLIDDLPHGSSGATQHEETAIPYSFPSPHTPPHSPHAEHSESVTHAASYTIPPGSAPRKKPRTRTADEWTRSPQRYMWRSAAEGLLRPAASKAVLEANQLAVKRMLESRERRQAQEQAHVAARRQEVHFAASASMPLQFFMQNKGATCGNASVRSAVRGGGGHHSRWSKRLKCNQEAHHPPVVSLKAAGGHQVTCHRRWSLSRRQTRSSQATNDESVPRAPPSTTCSAKDTPSATAHVPQHFQLMPETLPNNVVDAQESQRRRQGSSASYGSVRSGTGSKPLSQGGKVRANTGGKRGSRRAVRGGEAGRPSTATPREQRAVVHVSELLGVHVLKDRCASAPSAERTQARLSRRMGVRGCFKALDAQSSNTVTMENSRVAEVASMPARGCWARRITTPESQLSELFTRLSKTGNQSRSIMYDCKIIPKLSKARSHARSMVEYVEAAHVAPWETYNSVLKVLKSRTPTRIPRSQYNSTVLGPAILPVDCRPSSVYT